MTVKIGLLLFPGVQLLDFVGPYETFKATPEAETLLIGADMQPLTASCGLPLQPTISFDDCPQLDVICVPGGAGVNPLLRDEGTLSFIRKQAGGARYITSVCTGSLLLGAAGLLKGKKATSHWYAVDFLEKFGAIYTPGRVVRDGNLITAGGITSGIDFGLVMIAELFGQEEAEAVQLGIEYAPQPPFNSGTPETAPAGARALAEQRLGGSRKIREQIFADM
jgi:cyclohexyl-isocyanide hydratase